MKPIRKLWCRCLLLALALAVVCWLLPGEAATQEPNDVRKVESKPAWPVTPPAEMSVFQVKHVQAAQLGRMIQEIWGGGPGGPRRALRVSTDERTNTLVVVADPDDTAQVKRLVSAIDVNRGEDNKNERRAEAISLKYIRADFNLEQELGMAISGHGNAKVDASRNLVFVSGDEKAIQAVERLLVRLDRPQAKMATGPDMQVRIVWLASGLTRKETPVPPEDLKDVVAELNKLGIENPRLVTQAIVTAQLGKQFRVEGLAGLDQPYRLSINGTVIGEETGATNRLQISVNATQAAATPTLPPVFSQIGRVETEITAPLGHSVVLGMTPTATSTSVFVVQILPKR
jgi:Bacterial type II/III secretion system short domain